MKKIYRTLGMAIVLLELALTTGCVEPNGQPNNTGTGALAGGLAGGRHGGRGALIGGLAGVVAGGLIGHMIDQDQRRRLQAQSPQTLQTIQHNDAVYQQQQQTAQAPTQAQVQPPQTAAGPAPSQTLIPLTVDDIKALDSAGVKKEAIIAEIERSKSVYTQTDIAALQQSNPNIDPTILECMKKTIPS
jgi:predicted lipid-binding transport protein (Tim44 family)